MTVRGGLFQSPPELTVLLVFVLTLFQFLFFWQRVKNVSPNPLFQAAAIVPPR